MTRSFLRRLFPTLLLAGSLPTVARTTVAAEPSGAFPGEDVAARPARREVGRRPFALESAAGLGAATCQDAAHWLPAPGRCGAGATSADLGLRLLHRPDPHLAWGAEMALDGDANAHRGLLLARVHGWARGPLDGYVGLGLGWARTTAYPEGGPQHRDGLAADLAVGLRWVAGPVALGSEAGWTQHLDGAGPVAGRVRWSLLLAVPLGPAL